MRCPKCGYISFDHVEECLKCKKNIKSASEELQGSVLNVPAPSFLKFGADVKESSDVETDFSSDISSMDSQLPEDDSDFISGDIQFSDDGSEDLELVSEELPGDSFEEEVAIPEAVEENIDGDIEVDLSQFEEVSDPEASFMSSEEDESQDGDDGDMLEISVPDELVDMSDLAPPEPVAEEVTAPDLDLGVDAGPVDLDLDDLNFDLALDDVSENVDVASEPIQETVLALDDIDFSEALSGENETGQDGSVATDMDEDLDFDLDLGGLSIHKDL